jgi:septal ring factor EnvC (AmiA/AmiB activator)
MGIRKKKDVILTPEQKLDKAKGEADSALIMFHQANDSLKAANREIDEALSEMSTQEAELERQIRDLRTRKKLAMNDKTKNEAVAAKLADFIN